MKQHQKINAFMLLCMLVFTLYGRTLERKQEPQHVLYDTSPHEVNLSHAIVLETPINLVDHAFGTQVGNRLNFGFMAEDQDFIYLSLAESSDSTPTPSGNIYQLDKRDGRVRPLVAHFGRFLTLENHHIYYSGLKPKGLYSHDLLTSSNALILPDVWLSYLLDQSSQTIYYVQDVGYNVHSYDQTTTMTELTVPFSDLMLHLPNQILYRDDVSLRLCLYDTLTKEIKPISTQVCSSFGATEEAIYFSDGDELVRIAYETKLSTFKKEVIASSFITNSHLTINNSWLYYFEPNTEVLKDGGYTYNLCRIDEKGLTKEQLILGRPQNSWFYIINQTLFIYTGDLSLPGAVYYLDTQNEKLRQLKVSP